MAAAESGGVFVSYRRQDSRYLAARLYDRLADHFGDAQIFMDVDTIDLGVDFAGEITRAVAACKVLVAVIGPNWLTAADERGHRRLDDPDDFVRLEIETALARGVRVIPILADGAVMPARQDLPQSLAHLTRRNALFIRYESFRSDTERLVTAIERVLTPGTTAQSSLGPLRINPALRDLAKELPSLVSHASTIAAALQTSEGIIVVRLFPDHTPKTVRNFVELAEGRRQWINPYTREATTGKLYEGTIFHRVIPNFMIQGGDPLGTGTGGPGYTFGDEIHPDLSFSRPYLLAMASDGRGTNGSQFFITTASTPWLNRKHTIFGEVIEGADVADRISHVKTDAHDQPVTDVVLESVRTWIERLAGTSAIPNANYRT